MKLISTLIIIAFCTHISKLQNEQNSLNNRLKGIWIKQGLLKDTLIFDMKPDAESLFILRTQKGNIKYKPNGLYRYTIAGKNANIQWMAASTIDVNKYYFNIDDKTNTLIIKDFYGAETDTLIFKKLNP
jgi:hypothetical protein